MATLNTPKSESARDDEQRTQPPLSEKDEEKQAEQSIMPSAIGRQASGAPARITGAPGRVHQ